MSDSNFSIRLKLFMDAVGLTSSQLADRCGIPRPSMSSILSGRNKKISDTLIGQIHSVFPQLSVLWLMFNEGEMFLPSSPDSKGGVNYPINENIDNDVVVIDEDYIDRFSDGIDSEIETGVRHEPSLFGAQAGKDSVRQARTFGGKDANESLRRQTHEFIDVKRDSQNLEFPYDDPRNQDRSILEGSEREEKHGSTRINKGLEGDLRTIASMRQIENLKANPRKVTHITVYYDDSTFETFIPGKS